MAGDVLKAVSCLASSRSSCKVGDVEQSVVTCRLVEERLED
jgi:hypothetical protein